MISGCYGQRLSFEISYSQEIHRKVSLTRLLDLINPNFASLSKCHCEERSDEAIPSPKARPGATWFEYAIASASLDACFSITVSVQARSGPGIASLSLAMTGTVTFLEKPCEVRVE